MNERDFLGLSKTISRNQFSGLSISTQAFTSPDCTSGDITIRCVHKFTAAKDLHHYRPSRGCTSRVHSRRPHRTGHRNGDIDEPVPVPTTPTAPDPSYTLSPAVRLCAVCVSPACTSRQAH